MSLCINPQCDRAKNQVDQGQNLFCSSCGSKLLIEDTYRVIKRLGEGGFGWTYLMEAAGEQKVLKILYYLDPKAISLFDQEAAVLQKLKHPGIPRVEPGGRFDYLPRGSDQPLRCLVMEYIAGETLEDYLKKGGYRPISERAAVRWLRELVEILVQVHGANYFHRDIKPSNIMIRPMGQLVLIDFGTAREETATYLQNLQGKGGTMINSSGYTPYEQAQGRAEYRSDFFALGRTFVFLLTGKTPEQFTESLKTGLQWQGSAEEYSRELKDLIDWLMCTDLDDRPANAQEILKKLVDLEGCDQGQTSTPLSAFLTKSKPTPTTIQSSWPNLAQPSIFTEKLPGGVLLEMVQLPGGEFLMGSPNSDPDAYRNEKPQHQVKLSRFAIGQYPVTQTQYQAVMRTNPSRCQSKFFFFKKNQNRQNPVENVSWEDAQAFCQKLSQITGKTYRLPTEAEWEYACRAGTTTRFYFGNDEKQLEDYAWYSGNSSLPTHPVGQKKPNVWGLYDMSGHVWEWCADSWHDGYANKPEVIRNNGNTIWLDNDKLSHVLRGGSWNLNSGYCRSACRDNGYPGYSTINIGFRVVCVT